MSEFLIGVSDFGGRKSGSTNREYRNIETGDNLYRILPPMHSLAAAHKNFHYWKYHFGFKGSDGKNKIIVCQEKDDFHTKTITEHCSICDMVYAAENELKLLQDQGRVTPEQVKLFKESKINPFSVVKRYCVWAVDTEGKIVMLQLKAKSWQGFKEKAKELKEKEGIDVTGVNGIYMNFRRSGMGRDTIYSVEAALMTDPNNPKSKCYKEHVISEKFVERLRTETVDLTTLYTPIKKEEVNMLVNASLVDRPKLVDAIWQRGQKEQPKQEDSSVKVSLPGGAVGVASVSVENGSLKVEAPQQPKPDGAAMSDEEFANVFGKRFG